MLELCNLPAFQLFKDLIQKKAIGEKSEGQGVELETKLKLKGYALELFYDWFNYPQEIIYTYEMSDNKGTDNA